GKAAGRQGRAADQEREFQRAAELIRVAGDAQEKFTTMRTIGASYRETGRLDDSLIHLEEGRELVEETRNGFMIAAGREELGLTHLARGALDMAEKHLLAALEAVRGNWELESRVRRALGQVYRQSGRADEARSEWERALELAVRHGGPQAGELRGLLDEV